MWQVLLAAAVAGSTSLAAKHLIFSPNHNQTPNFDDHLEIAEPNDEQEKGDEDAIASEFDSPEAQKARIFRFSSSGSSSTPKKIGKLSKKKSGIPIRRLKYGDGNDKLENRSGGSSVCLKKRRTAKTKPGACLSKDSSLFGWGVGMGIMYMISSGKAEINKLSSAVDETSKVVQELRTELYKRKSTQAACSNNFRYDGEYTQQELISSRTRVRDPNDIKFSAHATIDDIDCPSSVLTEEPEPEVLEMDKLEAQLESELQKLPWSKTEAPSSEVTTPYLGKTEVSSEVFHVLEGQNAVSNQNAVLPSELDQKLSHLLIEQQENQIVELQSELRVAQFKLHDKEAELQALKDCVRRLTEFSLSTVSDDEAEVQAEQGFTTESDNSKMESESTKSVVGMKRSICSA